MPADTYDLFRLTLIVRRPDDLFAVFDQDRETFISDSFAVKISFDHYATLFTYIPLASDKDTGAIVGKVGRAILASENAPPEQDFDETIRSTWKAAVIVIDPRPGVDGQKIAVQVDRKVGKPFSILRSLLNHLNERLDAPYTLEARPIFSSQNFWKFAKKHQGNIVSLTFEFVVPNGIWNTSSSLKEDLRAAHDNVNAEEVITTVKSETGIVTDSKPVAEAISYIESGSGSATAKTRDGETFKSTRKTKSNSIRYDPVASPRTAIARALLGMAKLLEPDKDE